MRRKLFFWLEKLKISPAERKAVSLLIIILAVLGAVNLGVEPASPFGDDYYAPLEREFQRRTLEMKRREEKLLARYRPRPTAPQQTASLPDTVPGAPPVSSAALPADTAGSGDKININTADAGTLQELPGIGPVYSRRIVEYRLENGPFTSYRELIKIKGIGKKRLEKLLPFIQLKDSTGTQ